MSDQRLERGGIDVLEPFPREILRRGKGIIPRLEKIAWRVAELNDDDACHVRDLGFMVTGPLARLLGEQGKTLDPSFDVHFARVVKWRPFHVADWIDALPLERRIALVRPILTPGQGRSGMPNPLLAACPHDETLRWLFETVSSWKRDRDQMKEQWACDSLVTATRAFAQHVPSPMRPRARRGARGCDRRPGGCSLPCLLPRGSEGRSQALGPPACVEAPA